MKQYLEILSDVYHYGDEKPNRTGINTRSITGAMFKHDMRDGFPLLTTKQVSIKNVAIELEFFIKGYTDKEWLKERGCHIWDSWCSPERVSSYSPKYADKYLTPYCRDLGPIYGFQWRHWGATYTGLNNPTLEGKAPYIGRDQLLYVIGELRNNPTSRRLIVNAWNPDQLRQMALPPCHMLFQLLSDGEFVDLIWYQRSVDVPLGLPYNIASYGMLLEAIAKTVGMKARRLVGMLADCHIYDNQLEGVMEQLLRRPKQLPTFKTSIDNVFDFDHEKVEVVNYEHHPAIKFPIAV